MPKKTSPKAESRLPEASAEPAAQPAKRVANGKDYSPSFEQISKRAYELYLARGRTPGHDCEDWIQAERELKSTSLRHN